MLHFGDIITHVIRLYYIEFHFLFHHLVTKNLLSVIFEHTRYRHLLGLPILQTHGNSAGKIQEGKGQNSITYHEV